jgi:uncharacterized protein (TIGR02001 family)
MRSIKSPILLLSLICAAVLSPITSSAEGLSFNLGAESSYDDQGKDFAPSLQGGVDYGFSNGFYIGNWNSTGKFGDELKSTVELDVYLGYAKELSNGLSFDVVVTRYLYPGVKASNGNDVNLDVSYGPATISLTKPFTRHQLESGHTLGLGLAHKLTDNLEAGFLVEREKGNSDLSYELAGTYDMGNDWSVTGTFYEEKPQFVLGISKGF